MKTYFWLAIYYGLARHLPVSSNRYFGKFSKRIRGYVCSKIFKYCGKNVNIEKGAWFGKGNELIIGENSGLGINCKVNFNTIIGKDVMMGPNLYMLESTHLFDSIEVPMRLQGRKKYRDQLIVDDDVWIGRDVMIIGSKHIRKGSIIGARCLLVKNYPEYSIVGGNPSQLIKSRINLKKF